MCVEVKCEVDGRKLFDVKDGTIVIKCSGRDKRIIEIPIEKLVEASKLNKTVLRV